MTDFRLTIHFTQQAAGNKPLAIQVCARRSDWIDRLRNISFFLAIEKILPILQREKLVFLGQHAQR
jgi:hypothetical protein